MFYASDAKVHFIPTNIGIVAMDSNEVQKHMVVTTKDIPPSRVGSHDVWIGNHYDAMDGEFLKRNISFIISLAEFVPIGWTKHLFWPIRQGPHPEDFLRVAQIIEDLLAHGEKVLVHCFAGIDRSPTAVMAWLVQHRKIPVEQAIEEIKKSRPVANPHLEWMGWQRGSE